MTGVQTCALPISYVCTHDGGVGILTVGLVIGLSVTVLRVHAFLGLLVTLIIFDVADSIRLQNAIRCM